MTINEAQDEVIAEFEDFTDWMDRYQMLIDLGNELAPLAEQYKNDSNLIDGCQSRVWVQCDYREGRLVFTADSDALITKGIIALLIRVLSNHTPKEIVDAISACEKVGLEFDAYNENLKWRINLYGNDCRKIGADIYFDDKAVDLNSFLK